MGRLASSILQKVSEYVVTKSLYLTAVADMQRAEGRQDLHLVAARPEEAVAISFHCLDSEASLAQCSAQIIKPGLLDFLLQDL